MKQKMLSKAGSRRLFKTTAVKIHKANLRHSSRGGIRL